MKKREPKLESTAKNAENTKSYRFPVSALFEFSAVN
jgi:hypothetical protein